MNTFIINLNDTIAMCDSLGVALAKAINTSQPCFQETETNWQDVWVAGIICGTIIIVFVLLLLGFSIMTSGQNKVRMEELRQMSKKIDTECNAINVDTEIRKKNAEIEQSQKTKENEKK